MARLLTGIILSVVLLRAEALCNAAAADLCITGANNTLNEALGSPGIAGWAAPLTAVQKGILCSSLSGLESCILANGTGCSAVDTSRFQLAEETVRTALTGKLGVECLNGIQLSTGVPLSSGDSGSASGSEGSASSGSAYGLLVWQWILLLCCIVGCCAGGGGGGAYAYSNMKKNNRGVKGGGKKGVRPQDDYAEQEEPLNAQDEPQMMPVYAEPVATVLVESGGVQEIVTGVDANRDGIPDALEAGVGPIAPAEVEVANVQPELFGPVPQFGLLPGATGSTIVPAAQGYATYTQPTYAAYGAYGGQPTTSYVQYAGTQSYTVGAQPQMASSYVTYAQPTYATTAYTQAEPMMEGEAQ